jgi:hypothetical protein
VPSRPGALVAAAEHALAEEEGAAETGDRHVLENGGVGDHGGEQVRALLGLRLGDRRAEVEGLFHVQAAQHPRQ